MDLNNFIEEAELLIKKQKKVELQTALKNIIGLLPESQWESALKILGKEFKISIEKVEDYHAWLNQIEDMDYHFEWEINEDFECNNYWDEMDDYFDLNNLVPKFVEILNYADELLNDRYYRVAHRLYARIMDMELLAFNEEMGEYQEVSLQDIIPTNAFEDDLYDHALNLLYTVCKIYTGQERLKLLHHFFQYGIYYGMGLKELPGLSYDPIEDWDEMLTEWIDYLQDFEGMREGHLLLEALEMSPIYDNQSDFYNLVIKVHGKHPEVVLKYFDKLMENDQMAAINFSIEGLDLLRGKFFLTNTLANRISNLVKDYEVDLGLKKEILLTVFYIVPSGRNLLTSLNLAMDLDSHKKLLDFVTHDLSTSENSVHLFFLQEFNRLHLRFKNNQQFLGWRQEEIGLIIPLFMLLLMDPKKDFTAEFILKREVFHRLGYEDVEEFSTDFELWKDSVELSEDQANQLLNWLQDQVDKRGQAVIKTEYRKQYRRMAGLVVALGEALENHGHQGAREAFIDQYYKNYYRARNFRAELDSFR